MTARLGSPVVVWGLLLLVTIGSLALGTDHGIGDADVVAAVLLGVAYLKVLAVGLRFMELGHADVRLRRAFCGYVAVAGPLLVILALVL